MSPIQAVRARALSVCTKKLESEDKKIATEVGGSLPTPDALTGTTLCIQSNLTTRDARILDVGCANGGVLARMKKLGFRDLCGFDLPPGCLKTRENWGSMRSSTRSWSIGGMRENSTLSYSPRSLKFAREMNCDRHLESGDNNVINAFADEWFA